MEYLLWTEDLNATGIMAGQLPFFRTRVAFRLVADSLPLSLSVYAGYSLEKHTVPEADIGPYVQEALGQVSRLQLDSEGTRLIFVLLPL